MLRIAYPREIDCAFHQCFGIEMIWKTESKSLCEIGELFDGLDYAAVAQRIRRKRSAHTARARSNLIAEMLNV
jgi:hypothetical protein